MSGQRGPEGMRLIICGGRDFQDHEDFHHGITEWLRRYGTPAEVVTGGATGADALGKAWALEEGIPHREFPADWSLGRKAGPLRNKDMAEYAAPDGGCLAFSGGVGTDGMVRLARATGLTVLDWRE